MPQPPGHVLCIAMNVSRAVAKTLNELAAAGHRITLLLPDALTVEETGGSAAGVPATVLRVPCPLDGLDPVVSRWETDPKSTHVGTPSATLWRARAGAAAYRLHRLDPVDLVVAAGPPYDVFAVAFGLHAEAGVPFVLSDEGDGDSGDDPLVAAARRVARQSSTVVA